MSPCGSPRNCENADAQMDLSGVEMLLNPLIQSVKQFNWLQEMRSHIFRAGKSPAARCACVLIVHSDGITRALMELQGFNLVFEKSSKK